MELTNTETIALEIFEHKEVTVKFVAFERKEATVKPVAKAKPQLKPAVTLFPVSIPVRERKMKDIETQRFDQKCFAVSKAMIRLLRHDPSVPREDDGAVHCDDIMKDFQAKFNGFSQWLVNDWITYLTKGR